MLYQAGRGKKGGGFSLMPFSSVSRCHHFASHSNGKCWPISPNRRCSMFPHLLTQKTLLIFQYFPQWSLVTMAFLSLPTSLIHRVCQRTAQGQVLCCVLGVIRDETGPSLPLGGLQMTKGFKRRRRKAKGRGGGAVNRSEPPVKRGEG